MHFSYADTIRSDFPELATGALRIDGVSNAANVSLWTAHFSDIASKLLAEGTEGAFPEIQAWRRAYARMGLKPTQYRCASEALLRRFRNEQSLPHIHPLVDLCNAISIAFAIPVAVFDLANVTGDLVVRRADGSETYETFGGGLEPPDAGEVIFADAAGRAHARRWVNRQSGHSAVRDATTSALIVAEAMHATADPDIVRLMDTLRRTAAETWPLAAIVEVPGR
jgi:DNA/RNA-binding domain of Phe-tRNA-synthetase-like protein